MSRRLGVSLCLILVLVLGVSAAGSAQELKPISLLPPQFMGGTPLMQALRLRPDQKIILAQSVGYPKR